VTLKLGETLPHSGVFSASLEPQFIGEKVDGKLPAVSTDDDIFSVFFGDEVGFSYVDAQPLDSDQPQTVQATGRIHLGYDAKLATFSKQFKGREIAVKTRFLMAEALFEMAKEHRKLGQADQARDEIARGKTILEEALRDFPDTGLAAQGDYLLANLAQELGNYGEAISRYSTVVSAYPDSEYAGQSQFKKALCYELQENYDQACEEYVKLTYIYPDHALVADATIRLGNYYYKQKSYKVSGRIFYQFHKKNPTHKLAPEALFLSAQCEYKQATYKEAAALFSQVIETYPDEKELRAEAMYWLGDSQTQLGDFARAYQTLKKLTWDYPDSKWAKIARGRLTEEAFMQASERQ
jgi:TolA-binding protein